MNRSNAQASRTNAIIFDLGGILVPDRSAAIETQMAANLRLTDAEFQRLMLTYKPLTETGELTLCEMYKKILQRLARPDDACELVRRHLELYIQTSIMRDPEVIGFIRLLRKTFTVACLTNTEHEIAAYNREHGLFDYFDRAFLSTEMGLRKPQPEIFGAVAAALQRRPEEILFIDDKSENVIGAQSVGMKALLFESRSQLQFELRRMKIHI